MVRDLQQGSLATSNPEKVKTLIVLKTDLMEPVSPCGKSPGTKEEDKKKEEEEVGDAGQVSRESAG